MDILSNRLANRHSVDQAGGKHNRPLIIGGREDIDPGKLARLENNILLQTGDTPHYLLEHHGLAYYACAEAREFGALNDGGTLIRFDAHPDSDNWLSFKSWELAGIFNACSNKSSEGSYLRPLIESGLISRIIWFRSSPGQLFLNRNIHQDLDGDFPNLEIEVVDHWEVGGFNPETLLSQRRDRLILDIDLDYFAQLGFEHLYSTANLIQALHKKAGLVIQAFSPDYINSVLAAKIAADLITNL